MAGTIRGHSESGPFGSVMYGGGSIVDGWRGGGRYWIFVVV